MIRGRWPASSGHLRPFERDDFDTANDGFQCVADTGRRSARRDPHAKARHGTANHRRSCPCVAVFPGAVERKIRFAVGWRSLRARCGRVFSASVVRCHFPNGETASNSTCNAPRCAMRSSSAISARGSGSPIARPSGRSITALQCFSRLSAGVGSSTGRNPVRVIKTARQPSPAHSKGRHKVGPPTLSTRSSALSPPSSARTSPYTAVSLLKIASVDPRSGSSCDASGVVPVPDRAGTALGSKCTAAMRTQPPASNISTV